MPHKKSYHSFDPRGSLKDFLNDLLAKCQGSYICLSFTKIVLAGGFTMSLLNFVHDSTRQMIPQGTLPPVLSKVFDLFHWAHHSWHWYRRGKTYLNPDNFLKLTSGHTLNYLIGNNRFMRLAAQCVLISNCVLECVEQQVALGKAYRKWIEAFQGRYPLVISHKWNSQAVSRWISSSTSHRLYVTFFESEQYLGRVMLRTSLLVNRFFLASMAVIDTVDAFSLNADADRAVNEFFVNGIRCLDSIAENREELVTKLRANQTVIDGILKRIGSPCQTHEFIDYIDKTAGKLQTANHVLNEVNKTVGGTVTEAMKFLLFGAMSTIGLSSVVPNRFVPGRGVFQEVCQGDENLGRFAILRRRDFSKLSSPQVIEVKKNPVSKTFLSLKEVYEAALHNQKK